MFYDEFIKLCNTVHKSPTAVAKEIGLSGAHVTKWKNGSHPTDATIFRVCDYFGLPYHYFDSPKGTAPAADDEELAEYLEELKNRSEMRMLFKLSKGATKEEVEQAVRIIEALRK